MKERLFITLQSILPQHALSQLCGKLGEAKTPWLKNFMIQQFIRHYKIDLAEAKINDAQLFTNFNDFFIRELKDNARVIAKAENEVASPVDGVVSEIGAVHKHQLLQAKQSYYDLTTLLGGSQELSHQFSDGNFATLYLAPNNYHRVHMPLTGKLTHSIYVPGRLFSVNRITTKLVPNLFARNERLINIFDTTAGPMAVIMVGALIVGSIQTTWMNTPVRDGSVKNVMPSGAITLEKGAELGHFKLGSTVILLFAKDRLRWAPSLTANSPLKLGQVLANILK